MGRSPRIHVPGRIHHVMARGNGGQAIVADTSDLAELRHVIATVKKTSDFSLYAYCLMTNHLHLLVRVENVPLSKIMQRISTTWSKRFNIAHRRMGHVFQGRFKSLDCDGEAYFKWLLRYIHLNPVKARYVGRPEEWEWSSYSEYLHGTSEGLADVEWPLSLFSGREHEAPDSFRRHVLQGLQEELEPLPMVDSREPMPPIERSCGTADRSTLADLVGKVAAEWDIAASGILSRSKIRKLSRARDVLAARGLSQGYPVAEIAKVLGVSRSAVSLMVQRATVSSRGFGG